MERAANDYRMYGRRGGEQTLVPGIILMGLTLAVIFFVLFAGSNAFSSYPYLFLMPWILGLAIVMAVPSLVLRYQGRFSFADPIVFATWSYFFPAFVVGGFFFACGWSQPFFLSFTQDPGYNLPLTIVLVALGYAGLAVGYFLPVGRRLGESIKPYLPTAEYDVAKYIGPGIGLLIVGIFNTVAAFALGILGYQKADEINSYDGLIYLTTLYWMEASFLLWFIIFRRKRLTVAHVGVIVLLVATAISKALFAGNRGSVIQIFSIIALAYLLSGKYLRAKQGVAAGIVLTLLTIAGMIYGTTFRSVKGGEAQQGMDQYAYNITRTFDQIQRNDSLETLQTGFASLTERIDILTTLSVVVSNYEQLAPYEEAYDLDNNIWKDMTTSMVPRIIWKEKPSASDPRKFGDLYFNYGESSFAITPIGDLLRNYGMLGIPLGMLIIGVILRFFYQALIESQPRSIWRSTVYFMLLMSVSYEGFYGTIIPTFLKVGFVAVVGVFFVTLFIRKVALPGRVGPIPLTR